MDQLAIRDYQWLTAIKEQNDTTVFAALYRYFWKDLYQHVARRVHDKQDAEDILQELFVQFWDRRHQLDLQMNLPAYLKGMLKFKIIDYFNASKSKPQSLDLWSEQLYQFVQDNPQDLETYLWLEKLLDKELTVMPENMRKIMLLKWENCTNREIAKRLGLSEQTVKNNLTEAGKRFKKVLINNPDMPVNGLALLSVFLLNLPN